MLVLPDGRNPMQKEFNIKEITAGREQDDRLKREVSLRYSRSVIYFETRIKTLAKS